VLHGWKSLQAQRVGSARIRASVFQAYDANRLKTGGMCLEAFLTRMVGDRKAR
jgi:hypothetical protein